MKHAAIFGTLVTAVLAQTSTPSLTDILSNTAALSTFREHLQDFPDFMQQLEDASDITILAPSNIAFTDLLGASGHDVANDTDFLEPLLTYHVLNGLVYVNQSDSPRGVVSTMLTNQTYTNVTGGQTIEYLLGDNNLTLFSGLGHTSSVSQTNLNFTGGVIHVIDSVLNFPAPAFETAIDFNLTAAAGLFERVEYLEVIDDDWDVTIFMPSNAAFQALGSSISKMSTDQLLDIAGYHIISGAVLHSPNMQDMVVSPYEGDKLNITKEANGRIFVNSAEIIHADIITSNGVIHILDNVLNPNDTTSTPDRAGSSRSPAFSGAAPADRVPFTSGVPTAIATGVPGSVHAVSTSMGAAPPGPMRIGAAAILGAGFAAAAVGLTNV